MATSFARFRRFVPCTVVSESPPVRRESTRRKPGRLPALIVAIATALGAASANAQTIVQDYYVPMPEQQIRTSFLTLYSGTGTTMDSVVSIVVAVTGTRVTYDHWEDGYEVDINNPVQATTAIWGDGNNANGIPPGYANDPLVFSAGSVIALRNLVTLPRNAAIIRYDGRDRAGATRGIVMSRSAWATTPGSVLADATEVQATIDWGTSYIVPLGQNVIFPAPATASMFEYTSLMVMAAQNNTVVQIDVDGNGSTDVTTTIHQGESYQVHGGVMRGATVNSSKPVQVQLLTGDINAGYESRWFTIPSTDQWTPEYYSPVGTASDGDDTYLWVYNPNAAPITINYTTQTGSGSFAVGAGATVSYLAPQNSGTKLESAGGENFFAVGTVGAEPTQNNVHDWGFSLVPTENLTTEAVVGWGPGTSDLSANGSPVWVTAIANTTIYVDWNGDHAGALTDPAGGFYDQTLTVSALQVSRIFESDRDQTGMRLYTLDGTMITAAWGQDPANAQPGNPYLDVGTTIPNFPVPTIVKSSSIFTDNAPAGLSVGDVLEYSITLDNKGLVALGNTVVTDALPPTLAYVPGSTERDGNPIADAGVTAYPLDESGIVIPVLPRKSSTTVTYRATIVLAGSIVNTATASTGATSTNVETVPPGVTDPCGLQFTDAGGTPIGAPTPGDGIYVTLDDSDANTSALSAQSVSVSVVNSTSGDVETITLVETGVNTGVFRNTAALPSSDSSGLGPNDGTLNMVIGDTLDVDYTDPLFSDTCSDTVGVAAPTQTKILYLDTDGSDGDTAGDLDRVDPAAAPVDGSTSNTSTLAAPTSPTITAVSTTSSSSASGTTLTFSHTPGAGSNRILLVSIGAGGTTNNSAPGTISSVTYGGTAMTQVGNILSTQTRSAIYALSNPAAGPLNVVVTMSSSSSVVASATTFANVNIASGLTTALGTPVTNSSGSGNPTVTFTSAAGELGFSTASADEGASNQSITVPGAQTSLWENDGFNFVTAASSTEPGAASVNMTYTLGDGQEWATVGVSIRPAAATAGGTVTFTQTPNFCENFTLPVGAAFSSQAYFQTISGAMPANPSVSAVLRRTSGATIATSTSAASDGTRLTFTFPALGSAVTVPPGDGLQLVITNNQTGVSFQVRYDSSTHPSFVSFTTTTVIHVDSVTVYDAAYAGGSATATGTNGQVLYVRTVVGDPFGAADITSLPLVIDGSGVADDVSVTLDDPEVVASTSCEKTFEYVWNTGATEGAYTITATANEGSEGTVTDSKSTSVTLSPLDLGTPCGHEFTTGLDGAPATTYAGGEQVCVRVTDIDENTLPASAETVLGTVTSGSGDSEEFTLNETGVNTGIFAGCIPASTSGSVAIDNGTLYAPLGSSLSATYTDPDDSSDTCGDSGSVPLGSPAISLDKTLLSPTDGIAVVGEAVQYRVRVTNTGNTTLATVVLDDAFPAANLTFVSASPSPSSTGAGTLHWNNIGPMDPADVVDVIVNFTAAASAAPAMNSATADAGGGVNATDNANVTITNPSLTVVKDLVSPNPGPADLGDNVVFSLTVDNTGDTTIDTLPFEDTFSGACFTYVSASLAPDGTGYGSITWNDITGAGSLAPADPPIVITVTLEASGACSPATNLAAADFVTDVNGDPVPPDSDDATITTLAASISGTVYEDQGAAGFGGDVPLEGVTVTLYSDPNGDGDPSDGTVIQIASTLADGSYEFTNLGLGNYVVVESDPIGYSSIDDTAGAAGDNRVPVVVATLTAYTGNDFLDDLIDTASYGSISGQVRDDTDGDGNLADPDTGIAAVTIELYTDPNGDGDPSDGLLFLTTTTNASGSYSFPSIPPGNYVVAEVNPGGYNSTADASAPNDDLIPVVLPASTAITGRDFLDTTLSLADLSITKDDGTATYTPGGVLTYTIVASNAGPSAVTGATVADTFPPQLHNIAWTCSGSGGGTCPASGTGNLSASVDLPVGASVTFVVNVDVIAGATVNPLTNTATVTLPGGFSDLTPANNTASDSDTPVIATSSIGDRLWVDEDGDGQQDAGEDGIAGATVRLYDSTGVTLLASTVTDTDGRYLFTGLAAGNYVVRVDSATLPAGLAANPTYDLDNGTTNPNGETAVTAVAGTFVDTADFGYNWVPAAMSSTPTLGATGTIGDRIWNDADSDGVQDFGESGIAGVTVRLLVDSNGDGVYGGVGDAAAVTTTTNAAGNYIFDGLTPSAYVVQVDTTTLPAGFTTTPTGDPDSDGNNASNPVVIAPGDVWLRGDFGYNRPAGFSIGDRIWLDLDADGVQDGGEPGIAGVTVVLRDSGGNVVASTTTDASGNYLFPGLANGTYSVVVTDTAAVLVDTPTNTGDPDGGGNRTSTVVISGASNLNQDFGFAPSQHEAGDGLIGDTIFLDRDGDLAFDAGEGMSGVTVSLYDSTNTTLIATVVTDANGQYVFGGLDATRTYVVRVETTTLPGGGAGLTNTVDPDGGTASRSTVDLTTFVGGVTLTQDFGYRPAVVNTIGGTIWRDSDADGTLEGAETGRFAGVVVVLRDSGGDIVGTTTTDASGNYSFTGLPNGTYSVDVAENGNVLGGYWKSNGANPGVNNNSQTDAYTVTVTGGATNNTADFGYYRDGASLGNYVWFDTDNDGIQDGGEVGIPGAVVTLAITYPSGDVTTIVTTTDAAGAYSFGNLLLDENFDGVGAGEPTFSISVATPSGYQASPIGAGGNPLLDSNNPAGSSAIATKGVTSTTDNLLASNGIDFGFTPVTDVGVDKTGPASVIPGSNVVFTVVVTNNGPSAANAVSVADPTPAGLVFVSNTGDCTGAYPCSLGTLAVSATRTITSTYTVPAGYVAPDPIVNTATVSTTTVDTVPANDSDSASVTVTPQADVAVTKTGPPSATPGSNVVYTITVTNNGLSSAAAVSVADPTPAGLTFVSNSGDCVSAYPCALGTLAPLATRTITTTYSVPPGYTVPNPILNTATVSSTTPDPVPANNTDTESTPLAGSADLSISKDDGTAVYTAGGSLTYTITASNAGPSNVVGATVSDTFPPQLQNITWTCSGAGGGTCAASGSGNLSELVDLPVGASVTFLVSTDVISGATVNPLTNTATVSAPLGVTDPTPANNTASDSDTPAAAAASIGDRLWLDEDGDGQQDAGEDGLAGVTVELYDSTGTTLLASTTTDSDGRYLFTGLAAANYVVRVDATTLPAGLAANPTYDLDDGTTAPDGETAVTAVAGELIDTGDFGYNWVAPATSTNPAPGATGAIGDRIWNDANGDGVQNFGEAGIDGVTVRLLVDSNGDGTYGGVGDAAAVTTTTDAAGNYIFDDLAPGAYVLDVDTTTLPAGFTTTPTGDPDSDGDNTSEPVVIAPGDVWVRGDFGYTLPTGSTIGDTIYLDVNGDGVQDVGELGIPGVTVSLLDNSGDVIASTTTDASGNYFFPGLPDGAYSVVVTDNAAVLFDTPTNTGDPDGGNDRISSVVLAGADNLAQDFGFAPAGHDPGDGLIGDTIFLDRDTDGVADSGEGIEGVAVQLYDATGTTLIATVVTDANGQYVFGGLDPSETYVVRVVAATLPGAGAGLTNTVDPDLGIAGEASVDLSLFAGGVTLDQDFGYEAAAPNTIGGTLWNDSDGDGTLDAGETVRFADVVVVLRDSNGNVVATTTTDASGNYQFTGLPDGTYTLDVAEDGNELGGLTHSDGPSAGADNNSQFDAYSVTVAGGTTNTTGDFGYYPGGAAVGNFVWSDLDNDGVQDVGEPGIAGVPVTLTITYPNGDVTTVVTVTDALGAYDFGNLLLDEDFDGAGAGEPTYSISVATPAGYQASPVGAGGDVQLDSNNPAGAAATAAEGVTDTTNDALASNGFDFGFTPLTDVQVEKTAPATIVPGTNAVFTVVVTNNGPSDALAVSVADPTPAGLSFVSNAGDCTTAYPCALGTLANGATRTITTTYSVPASYTTPNPVVNTATVSTTSTDTVPANDTDSASAPVVGSADMAIVKVGPGAVTPGTNIVYTLVVTNNGVSDAAGVSVADPTPSGLTFVSNTGDCTTAFPCALGTVAAGATRTITSTFSVPLLYTTPDPIVNTATVSSTTPDPVPGNNSDDASTTLSLVQADLAVVKTAPASATPGTNVVFTVVVTNNGPATATSVVVTDPTPGGLAFVSNSGDCTTTYPCSLGTLANGATRTITSTYAVPASYAGPNPISNTAVVSGAEADPVPGNNSSTDTVPVTPSADLEVVKSAPALIVPGTNAVFTVVVTNFGPSNAAAVSVADPTPTGLTFVSNSGDCTTAYPCSLGTVPAGATRTITTTFSVPLSYTTPDPVENTATVSSTTPDPDPLNNTSTVTAPVAGIADVSVVKGDSGVTVARGGLITYSIVVTNNGPQDATNVVAVDTLDVDTTYVGDTGACVQAPAGTLTCPIGSLASGSSTSFSVTVSVDSSAPVNGTRENGTCNGAEDLCNTVTVSASEADPTPANNTDTEPSDVAAADLMVVKSDPGTGVTRLEDFAYTIVVTNVGTITATNVTAIDNLDVNTTYISDTIGCVESPASVLTCPIGTLAPGASMTFNVVVQVGASAPTNGGRESGPCNGGEDLCNTITVSATEGDANPMNNTEDEPTNVSVVGRISDLSITKVDATGPVQAGSFSTYTIAVTNAGPDDAQDVQVIDTLDPSTTYVGGTLPCVQGVAGLLACQVGDIATGATVTFDLIMHIDPAAPSASTITGPACPGTQDVCNRASVSSPASDPNPNNNVSVVSTDVLTTSAVSQLSLAKSDVGAEPVLPGSDVTYQIVVSNAGPNDAEDVIVYETLDRYMTYVSDTAGCVPTTVVGTANTTLACPLGTIAAGSSAAMDIVVTMAVDAPYDSTMQDGDCDDLEDVCNEALVTTSSADFTILDNQDSEPTDVSLSLTCNDGSVDPGEQCDPPNGEVCNNGIDDDGNLMIDCGDPVCQVSTEGCNGNCLVTPPCQPILNDPAKVKWNTVHIHGRFVPVTPADPFTDGFRFVIANEAGVIYSAELLPGDMKARHGAKVSRWTWKDRTAKRGRGLRDGLFRVGIHERIRDGELSYVFTISGYGDMSKALTPKMITLVYIGDDSSYLEAEWLGKPGAWYLTLKAAGN